MRCPVSGRGKSKEKKSARSKQASTPIQQTINRRKTKTRRVRTPTCFLNTPSCLGDSFFHKVRAWPRAIDGKLNLLARWGPFSLQKQKQTKPRRDPDRIVSSLSSPLPFPTAPLVRSYRDGHTPRGTRGPHTFRGGPPNRIYGGHVHAKCPFFGPTRPCKKQKHQCHHTARGGCCSFKS